MLLLVAIISDILGHPNFVRVLSEKIRESKEGYSPKLLKFPKFINPASSAYICLRMRATGMSSISRYFATVRRAMR